MSNRNPSVRGQRGLGKQLSALFVATAAACAPSSEVDPRCTINTSELYRGQVAQRINASKLWRTYFDQLEPVKETAKPLVSVDFAVDRKITTKTTGDYDDGYVRVRFSMISLRTRTTLYSMEESFRLDSIVFVPARNATRDEIQTAAFEAVEKVAFRYVDRWVNLAAIRAMAEERSRGSAFVPILEKQAQDEWAEDLMSEARIALRQIRGGP